MHALAARVTLALTLTRCDWNEPGVVARTLERLRRALGFVDELARRAAALGALQGAVLQALLAWLAKEQQRLEEARRLAEPSEAGAEGHADPAEVAPSPRRGRAPASTSRRRTLCLGRGAPPPPRRTTESCSR